MVRNREILYFAAFCLGVGAVGMAVGFVLSPAAGLLAQGGLYAAMWADYQRSAQWKAGKETAV